MNRRIGIFHAIALSVAAAFSNPVVIESQANTSSDGSHVPRGLNLPRDPCPGLNRRWPFTGKNRAQRNRLRASFIG